MKKIKNLSEKFTYDLPASISVFLVAIPLCLGIAHASGAPLFSGIIGGFIGGILVGALSKSPLSVSGPTASLTAIVLSGIRDLGSFEIFLLALLIAGMVQVLLGILKAGALSAYLPSATVMGMSVAIGLILIIKQLPHLIGYDIEEFGVEEFDLTREDINETYHDPHEGRETNSFTVLLHSIPNLRMNVFLIGAFSLVSFFVWDRFFAKKFQFLPASLIAIAVGTSANLFLGDLLPGGTLSQDHLVTLPVFQNSSDLFGQLDFPNFSAWDLAGVWTLALTIAFASSLESLLSIEVVDKLDGENRKTPMSRELVAQGFGNMACGLLGGIPVTSVVVRGSVNAASGARSKTSAVLHGVWIGTSVLLFPKFMNTIPLASLAAILVVTGFKLCKPALFKTMLHKGYSHFLPFLVTVLTTIFTNVLIGTFCGILASLVFMLYEDHRTAVVRVENYGKFRRIVLGENLGFFHKAKIKSVLESQPSGITLEIDGTRTLHLDLDIRELIHEFRNSAYRKGIKVILGGIPNMQNDIESLKKEMSESYQKLLSNNETWVKEMTDVDPEFFARHAEGQTPQVLFIGCSDSRVPVNVITKTNPGEIFVTRNIANVVSVDDMSLFSVVQYAIEVLNVKHIVVCGHTGCGGVRAALKGQATGLIDNWITHIKDVYLKHREELDALPEEKREDRMIQLNVAEQVVNLYKTGMIQNALAKYGFPEIHGWVYDIRTGQISEVDYKDRLAKELGGLYGYSK
ncbi:sulfate permease [Leptospira langatensis]|uniref:Carbonic anhydrase 2 n=1 Tax=Leptospira langatensis TaxID=2484983 RepID=A0A5F1ZUX4_9LEPT|nr:carbonic anhydrase [Leptospira langatensis]TGK01211.1 sulfate permease [Leptospira langatensis]TGL42339.1 sulfate permease [Leptospira langatensis]